jgi:AraC-like DNA-binding protein
VPKWVFLEYLARTGQFLFHGSRRPDLAELQPRVAGDYLIGSHQARVYATSSGLMAAFSAILNRRQGAGGVGISSILSLPLSGRAEPWQQRVHIAVDYRLLPTAPWTSGCVYVLPKDGFTPDCQGIRWYRETPVRPLARIAWAAHEWPMLEGVRAVNLDASIRRFNRNPRGLPWFGDPDLYPARPNRQSLCRARVYVEEHFAEKISLEQLGNLADMSPFHLARTFRAATGLSPFQYQLHLRLTRARSLLCSGKSAAAVAASTGFVDQSHLTRHFKRALGLTPGRFLASRFGPLNADTFV